MKNSRAVVPKIRVQDAIKQIIDSSKEEYIVKNKTKHIETRLSKAQILFNDNKW